MLLIDQTLSNFLHVLQHVRLDRTCLQCDSPPYDQGAHMTPLFNRIPCKAGGHLGASQWFFKEGRHVGAKIGTRLGPGVMWAPS